MGGGWVGRGGAALGGTREQSSSFCVSAASPSHSREALVERSGWGTPSKQPMQPSPARGGGAVSLNAQRSRGQRAANAFPWHRGRRGCGAACFAGFQSLSAEPGSASRWPRRRRGSTPATPPSPPRSREPAMPGGAQLLPSPPRGVPPRQPGSRAPHTNFCPASPTSAAGSDWRSRSGSRRSAGRLEQPRPAERTSLPWLWCLCTWVAVGWPPGSALQLRPGM